MKRVRYLGANKYCRHSKSRCITTLSTQPNPTIPHHLIPLSLDITTLSTQPNPTIPPHHIPLSLDITTLSTQPNPTIPHHHIPLSLDNIVALA
ncbi:hypothetical protein Pmani_029127 [Petrolisthes manimaculis]|uniref:Uncharacterized protein n=1 Tax=Petrolisthes manimaculis TaxID=1843537 RepID=A0AAE1P0U0_9EUCA|nr:hypothetical protein Pmani_029127 [Petrolisthes manimaculis]